MSSLRSKLLLFILLLLCVVNVANANQKLRSAFLGPERWDDNLTVVEVNDQLKDHFREVLEILESQSSASLKKAAERAFVDPNDSLVRVLSKRREIQIARLREYLSAGTFPLNEGQGKALGQRAVPIFVDRQGTHCAVGFLMHRDGWDEQVTEIVNTNNLVYIPEIQDGAFLDWVAHSGLTREEAALIQPGYAPPNYQVTLAEMSTTTPTLTREGYTVSGLTIDEISFASPDGTSDGAWELGRSFYENNASSILPYRAPADVGFYLGAGNEDPNDFDFRNQATLDEFLFLGTIGYDLGQPRSVPGEAVDSILYRLSYNIESNVQSFDEFGLSSGFFYNFNDLPEVDSALRVQTRLFSGTSALPGDTNLVGELDLSQVFDVNDFNRVNDSDSVEINEEQLHVETFALAFNGAVLTSLTYQLSSVPEPGSFALLFAGMAGCVLKRRRT